MQTLPENANIEIGMQFGILAPDYEVTGIDEWTKDAIVTDVQTGETYRVEFKFLTRYPYQGKK